jgi:hypothetical protein
MWTGLIPSRSGARRARDAESDTPTSSPVRIEPLEIRTLLAADSPFTVVMMPDTQIYAWKYPDIFHSQTRWISTNAAARNMVFLTHVGDVVENPNLASEWTTADTAMDRLDGVLPYSVAIGNHDYYPVNDTSGGAKFVQWFGSARYAGRSWYGGAAANQLNHFQTFSAGGWQFLHVALEWQPTAAALSWAQSVINAHPGMPTIVTTHEYLTPGMTRSTPGTNVWNGLIRQNPQVFMVMNGHYTGEAHRVVTNDAGKPVIEMLVDFQGNANGGDGYLRLLKFVPAQNRIEATTYSPWLNQSYTDADSQFTITMDFTSRFGPPTGQGSVSASEVLVPATNTNPSNGPRRAPAVRPTFSAKRIMPARNRVEVLHDADDAPAAKAA